MDLAPDQLAPSIQVPKNQVIVLEHPCIIQNLDRGIKSLGGKNAIQDVSIGLLADSFNHSVPTKFLHVVHEDRN
jgi:hypothetical protein